MANTKKAIEEVTEKEIPRAAYEGVLTIDVDAQVERTGAGGYQMAPAT